MKSLQVLKRTAQEGLDWLKVQPDVREAEVFVADNEHLLARLNYTSAIPSNGVEEPKSTASFGVGVRVALNSGEGVKYGFGSAGGILSEEGVRQAFAKAQQGAVLDPEFTSLPRPSGEPLSRRRLYDPEIMALDDADIVRAGWTVLNGALDTFCGSRELAESAGGVRKLAALGLIVSGDVTALRERIAVAATNLPEAVTDESTSLLASATTMIERENAKGSGWSVHSTWKDFDARAGIEAARNVIGSVGGRRVKDGEYRVIFGPQPVADIFHNLVLPSLQADMFYAMASPFLGKLGSQIAGDRLSVYDHGALPRFAASRRVTCEGLPTGRTDLIRQGKLVGLLSNYYESQRLLRDPNAGQKLGVAPGERAGALAPRNGFRFMDGAGRSFQVRPFISPTNVFIESDETRSQQELMRWVGDGLYIGRIWYTYPINGLLAGDFTCTVVGDSYLIKGGKILAPLKPNTVRINDDIHRILNGVVGVGEETRATSIWSAPEIIYAPEMAVDGVPVKEIGSFLESQ